MGRSGRTLAQSCRDAIPELKPNMNMLYALRSYHEYSGDKRVQDERNAVRHDQQHERDGHVFAGDVAEESQGERHHVGELGDPSRGPAKKPRPGGF